MLVKNEDTIDIIEDGVEKGMSKKMFLYGLISFFVLFMLAMWLEFDLREIGLVFGIWCAPSYGFVLLGFSYLIYEKKNENNSLLVTVSKDYVEFFEKKKSKKILLKDTIKIDKISFRYGNFIVIYYKESEKQKKYQFEVSRSNLNLVCMAIKEFDENIDIVEL